MIKKISSVILAVVLLVTCMAPVLVSADAPLPYLEDERQVSVGANIELRAAGGSYDDGPVSATYSSVSAIPKYDFKATLDMTNVKNAFNYYFSDALFSKLLGENSTELSNFVDINALKPHLYVTGSMTVTINVPAGITVNDAFLATKEMNGFGGSKDIHEETTVERKVDSGKIIITTQVKDPTDASKKYVKGETLYNGGNLDAYLGEIYLECTDNIINSFGTHTISGKVEGETYIYLDRDMDGQDITNNDNKLGLIKYKTDEVSETITVSQTPSYGGGGGGSVPKPSVTIDFSVNGDKTLVEPVTGKNGKVTVNLDEIIPPAKPGYIVDMHWYEDPAHTKPVSGEYTATKNTTLYTYYINGRVPSAFVEDHHGYIQGYPDGEVKPNKNVSREEVAALLYRLLKEDVRESLRNNENYFSDVEESRWSHSEIATMVKGGYIKGYDDGTFRPGQFITRAEFATLITRFIDPDMLPAADSTFSDISGHWAEEYIIKAVDYMLITGYTDGTFKPDKYITRAEAVTILNRILVRYVGKEGLHEDAKHWPDNNESDWYYYNILEATNSHEHIRLEDGYTEDWHEHNESTDWTQH